MTLPFNWNLPKSITDRLGSKIAGRQRAIFEDDHLLLILYKPPQLHQTKQEAVFFWRNPEGRWECSQGLGSLELLNQHLREFSLAIDKLFAAYKQAEDAEDYFRILENLSPLHLTTKNLYATFQTARDEIPSDKNIIDFRDWAYEMDRNLEILYTNTKNALDFSMAKKAEEQAKSSLEAVKAASRLNTLAAIFFPLTAISCVFGMNLPSGLENNQVGLFWLILIIAISIGLLVRKWVQTGKF